VTSYATAKLVSLPMLCIDARMNMLMDLLKSVEGLLLVRCAHYQTLGTWI